MLTKNQTLTAMVEGLGANGEGVLHHEGQALFVPYALPGEEVKVRIEKATRSHAFGKVLGVLRKSESRVEPPCPYFYRCGGCVCQHMAYETQRQFKQDQVQNCLLRIGGLTVPVSPVIGMENPWRYRNKTAMPVQDFEQGPKAGYYAPRSHRLIPIDFCLIADPASDLAKDAVLQWMQRCGVPAYNEERGTGLVRHIVTRTNRAFESLVTLAVNGDDIPDKEQLIALLKAVLPAPFSLSLSIQKSGGNVILGSQETILYGPGTLTETLGGLTFELGSSTFFQVNREVCEKMYRHAIFAAREGGGGTLLDLYCGVGTISLMAAKYFDRVIGIDVSQASIASANINAARNDVKNALFYEDEAEKLLPDLLKGGLLVDSVILDPPRKGAHPDVLSAVVKANPGRIVYISCHPPSQARDAAILEGIGYEAVSSQPFDMFCQTGQVENVLVLQNKTGEKQDEQSA